ncbi:hypothetical protein KKC62_01085 [Patescibacteria group bacterium]|nr:hypothetical protein [Patescibacteria group bacterium]MBU1952793.1 hypothetical protein [Patescibacteria group bacterium]
MNRKVLKKYKHMYKNTKEKGIALVEVIAALGIAVIVITSLVSLSISTMRSSLKSKLLLEGSKIANREIELVRAFRDNSATWEDPGFLSILSCTSSPCYMKVDGSGIASGSAVDGSGTEAITRYFTVTNSADIVRVSVSVTWKVGNDTHGAYVKTDLSNWRGR